MVSVGNVLFSLCLAVLGYNNDTVKSKTIITIVCCVCKKYLGEKDGKGISGVSHGYCDECLKKEMAKLKE